MKPHLRWTISTLFIDLSRSIGYTSLYFLIWEQLEGTKGVIELNLFTFVGLILASLIIPLLPRNIVTPKRSYFLGVAAIAATYGYVAAGGVSIGIIGILYGFGAGIQFDIQSAITMLVNKGQSLSRASALMNTIGSFVSIISPPLIAFLANSLGYLDTLLLFTFIILIVGGAILTIPVERSVHLLSLKKLILGMRSSQKLRKAALISTSIGIVSMFQWGLLSVIMLGLLGNIEEWSIVTVALSVFTIILSNLLKKLDADNDSSALKVLIVGPTFLLILTLIFLMNNFTTIGFIIFSFVYRLFTTVYNVTSQSHYVHEVSSDYPEIPDNEPAFMMYMSLFKNIARLLFSGVLLLLPATLLTAEWLVFILAIVSIAPLVLVKRY